MEKQTLEDVSPEALKAQKAQKSRNRFFGLFVIIDLILLGVLIYEIISLVGRI